MEPFGKGKLQIIYIFLKKIKKIKSSMLQSKISSSGAWQSLCEGFENGSCAFPLGGYFSCRESATLQCVFQSVTPRKCFMDDASSPVGTGSRRHSSQWWMAPQNLHCVLCVSAIPHYHASFQSHLIANAWTLPVSNLYVGKWTSSLYPVELPRHSSPTFTRIHFIKQNTKGRHQNIWFSRKRYAQNCR